MKTIKLILLSTILLLLKEYAGAQVSYNVPAPNTVINTRRAVVTGINTSSSSYVISYAGTEEEGSGYWPTPPNNRLLVMLMSKTSGPNPTRNWQIVDVISSDPSSRTVTVTPFKFTNWGSISTTGSMIQIMNVPVYSDVTIDNGASLTCDPWNNFTGGVLCFIANGKIEVLSGDNDGAFNVAGKGFKQLVVNGGAGGRGGYRSSANGANSATPGDNGRDAAGANLNPALALSGQGELCFDGAFNIKGGNGGLGGTPIPGAVGAIGTPATTNGNLSGPSVPKLLMLGNSGRQGNGGNGGQAGGNGGNGGNGGGFGSIGALGQQGEDGGEGGKGGFGGRGGGIIITFSNELILPYPCVNIKGQNGGDGLPGQDNATFTAGKAGNGGNGGNGNYYSSTDIFTGYGGGGGKGLRGNGASGGNGGDGGKAGSVCMRTLSTNNDFTSSKLMPLRSTGGLGGAGKAPYAIPALDGLSGCAKPFVNIGGRTTDYLCVTRNYDEYTCAAFEALQVLGDMDFAEDFPGYVKFTKTTGNAVSKKSNRSITIDPKYYYCIYYKCSKLLVAYEDDYLEANATVVQMPGCSTTNQDAYRSLKGNFYWAKFNNVSCANCANIIKQFADDLKNNKYDPPTANHAESHTINGLKHDYGTITFGEGGKFTYADTYPAQEIGVLSEPAKNLVCIKQCTAFNKNWLLAVESCPCAEPSEEDDDDGGGGWGGSSDPNPAKPQIPGSYVDEPSSGEDGTPGEDGIGGAWGGGQYNPNDEDGLHETPPVYNAVEQITTANNFVSVWPNPVNTKLNLTFVNDLKTVNIKVMDVTGKIIWQANDANLWQQNIMIDVESWNGGTYFIEVTTTQQTKTFKFIKQ